MKFIFYAEKFVIVYVILSVFLVYFTEHTNLIIIGFVNCVIGVFLYLVLSYYKDKKKYVS